MSDPVKMAVKSDLREALARMTYDQDKVRIADPDLTGERWLVASHRGIFGVSPRGVKIIVHGWFFGICRHESHLFVFENCGHRDAGADRGRIVRFDLSDGRLTAPRVLATGLHNNCHQIAVIDGLLCVVDTANQAIRRFTLAGEVVDVQCPFPVAPPTDRTGAYLHINSIAKVGDRIGLMLHNGKALPEKTSEIAWLDDQWIVRERLPIGGHCCHDIVEDEAGRLWHAASQEGDIIRSDGLRLRISDTMMTRGIVVSPTEIVVGISTFGPRHLRGTLNGGVVLIDRASGRRQEIPIPGAPTDVVAI